MTDRQTSLSTLVAARCRLLVALLPLVGFALAFVHHAQGANASSFAQTSGPS